MKPARIICNYNVVYKSGEILGAMDLRLGRSGGFGASGIIRAGHRCRERSCGLGDCIPGF